jgi:hypothetical protein
MIKKLKEAVYSKVAQKRDTLRASIVMDAEKF